MDEKKSASNFLATNDVGADKKLNTWLKNLVTYSI
jgi:hypothetical protein